MRVWAWLRFSFHAAGLLTASVGAAHAEHLIFLSTQLRPITEQPQQFPVRIETEQHSGTPTIAVVGALHGELKPLAPLEVLLPLDDLATRLAGRGIPGGLLTLGKLGTAHQLYIPWMQASYVMVANRKALAYLPAGTDINALSYDELATWASTLQQKTGTRLVPSAIRGKLLGHNAR